MMFYASADQIRHELGAFAELALPSDDAALEKLISAAERAVDQRLGPYASDPISGRKLDPEALTPSQVDGLLRAVAVAVGHLSQLDVEATFGLDDFSPAELRPLAGAGLATKIDEQLAGLDLIGRSGTVLPDVDALG